MPLTFRLIFHGIRAFWVAVILAMLAWLVLVPASLSEQTALKNGLLADQPMGLAMLRVSRAMLHFAPERAALMLSRASDGELSPELAGMLLRQIAAGPGPQAPAPTDSTRAAGGAKFVQVERP